MNILISGVGGPTPIGIAKSILLNYKRKDIKLIGIDGSKYAPGLYNKLFDNTYLVPHSSDKDYWDQIEEIIKIEKIDFAFIVPELEVLEWSKKKEKGELPCKAFIPDLDVAKIMYNKYATYNVLKELKLVPISLKISNKTEQSTIEKELKYPYWVRGGSGAGAIGSFKVENHKDLLNWLNINPDINDFMASEFLPGKNYACKMLYFKGKLLRAASAERIDYLLANAAPSGISGMCARGSLLNNNDLIDKSDIAIKEIFKACNKEASGMFTVDFKEDHKGVAKIKEINIRHVSFTYAFALGGANFSVDALKVMLEQNLEPDNFVHYRFEDEYTFIRGVDSEIFIVKNSDLK